MERRIAMRRNVRSRRRVRRVFISALVAAMIASMILPSLAAVVPGQSGPEVALAQTAADVQTIRRFNTTEPIIVLTFDAGADRGYAVSILDTLKAKNVRASFGMTGVWASQNPDLIRRIVADGHHLMNHSWDHPSFPAITSAQRADQLKRTADLVRSQAGVELAPYFRPPFGEYNDAVLVDLARNGYTVNVMWTVDTLGWKGYTAAQIKQRVLDGAAPGAIMLMHVGAQSQDAAALPGMIDDLRAKGYRFATVHELMGAPAQTSRYFPETGYWVSHGFLTYWLRFGGLERFGYPITGEFKRNGVTTQYFERARFEWHPGTWAARYDVHLGLLGNELTAARRAAGEAPFRPITAGSDATCNFYPQTGHRLCFGFRDYWNRNGGLAIFGFPISEEFQERNPDTGKVYTVQYFERARFEWHPEYRGTRYEVLLGRLGAQILASE
jgi:peptidoglycan-N-acetylglucosamine deacetylase